MSGAVRNTENRTTDKTGVCPQKTGNLKCHARSSRDGHPFIQQTYLKHQGKTATVLDSKNAINKREVCAFKDLQGRGRGSHETYNMADKHAIE